MESDKIVLLDTNFILTCLKQKIDFVEEIYFRGFKILIPKQVIEELKILEKRRYNYAGFALKLIKEKKFKKVDLKDKKTDRAILKFATNNKSAIIATLDKELKENIENRKMVIRSKKKLEII